ncbi:MAG TPA: hypothetical protein VIO16_09850 [Dehalococcoidia bacterium]
MLTKDGNRNHDLLDDPDLAKIVKAQQIENDENKRLQLVYQAQQLADDKMLLCARHLYEVLHLRPAMGAERLGGRHL